KAAVVSSVILPAANSVRRLYVSLESRWASLRGSPSWPAQTSPKVRLLWARARPAAAVLRNSRREEARRMTTHSFRGRKAGHRTHMVLAGRTGLDKHRPGLAAAERHDDRKVSE